MKWCRRAAQKHYPPAVFLLGCFYDRGHGVQRDRAEALSWFKGAAKMGYDKAHFNLAIYFRDGLGGLTSDNKQAECHLRASAGTGCTEAINLMGENHEFGWMGFSPAPEKSFEYYIKAAAMGDARAEYNVARCYENGYGIKKDKKKAVQYFMRSARRGYAHAENYIGVGYLGSKLFKVDYKESFKWCSLAAAQGHPHATHIVGIFYEFGYGGVVKIDLNKAAHYKQLAKKLGYNGSIDDSP